MCVCSFMSVNISSMQYRLGGFRGGGVYMYSLLYHVVWTFRGRSFSPSSTTWSGHLEAGFLVQCTQEQLEH